jgi:hypothetical protein
VKRSHCILILLVTLLCSCAEHHAGGGSGEGTDSERLPERLPFLNPADPLVKRAFFLMEERARYSELREMMRAEGLRVCEEGESGPPWQEDCNTCWCDRGHRACTKAGCQPPWVRLQFEAMAREEAKRSKELREMDRAAGRRVCEEGESRTQWREDCNRCWCSRGVRVCTENVCQKSVRSKREKAAKEKMSP